MKASHFFRMVCVLSFLAVFELNVFAYEIPSNISKERIAEVQKKIDAINKRNIEKGYNWRAGFTSNSFLTTKERLKLCGTKIPEGPREITVGKKKNTASLKSEKGVMKVATVPEWKNYMGPIATQDDCGNCYVQAVCGVIEGLIQYRYGGKMNQESDGLFLDKGYLTDICPGSCTQGGYPLPIFQQIYNYRTPALDIDGNGVYNFPNYPEAYYGISSYTDHGTTSIAEIKSELQDSPVCAVMVCNDAFIAFENVDIWDENIVFESYGTTPLHAVVICGYNDADSCWTCKNSWGPGWGEDGYFRIKYGLCGIDSIACLTATVEDDECYAKICPALLKYVSNAITYQFATVSLGYPAEQIFICGDDSIKSGQTVTIPSGRKIYIGNEIGGNNGNYPGKSEIIIDSGGRFIIDNDIIDHRQESGAGYGAWGGIYISSGGKLELKGANEINHAKTGLYVKSDSVYCDPNNYTEINDWDTWGVIVSNASPYLHHISIGSAGSTSGPKGIVVSGSSSNPTFRNVGVYGICEIGMWVDAFSYVTFEKNVIGSSVVSDKIYLVDYGTLYMDHTDSTYANEIYDEVGNYAINIGSNVTSFNVRRNFWGLATPVKDNLFFRAWKITEWTPWRASYNPIAGKTIVNKLAYDDEAINKLMYAFDKERKGDLNTAAAHYKEMTQGNYPERYRMKAILSLYRIVRNHTKNYSELSNIINNTITRVSNDQAFVLNFILSDMLVYNGSYTEAISSFENLALKYSDSLYKANVYSRISCIYSNFLCDIKNAKEYAEKAAALCPGAVFVADAFASAGIEYATSKPAVNNPVYPSIFESAEENIASTKADYLRVSPNPANPMTMISWSIGKPSHVRLNVFTINGQKIATLVNGPMNAGSHSAFFNGTKFASGVYLYRFESESMKKTGKILLMK